MSSRLNRPARAFRLTTPGSMFGMPQTLMFSHWKNLVQVVSVSSCQVAKPFGKTGVSRSLQPQSNPLNTFVLVDAANAVQPSPLPNHKIPKGFPDVSRDVKRSLVTEKAKDILGIEYRSKEETAKDILEDFAKRGW